MEKCVTHRNETITEEPGLPQSIFCYKLETKISRAYFNFLEIFPLKYIYS
jgi:hypothetical protein